MNFNFVHQRLSGRDKGTCQVHYTVPKTNAELHDRTLTEIRNILTKRDGHPPTKAQLYLTMAHYALQYLKVEESDD